MSYTAPESINQASNSESSSSTETTYHTFRGKIASFLYMVPPLAASSTAEERLPLCSTTSSQDRNKRTLQVTPQSSSSESSPILTYTTHAPPTRPPTRLLPSLPEAYHSVPVPRARPGEASWLSRCRTLLAYVGPGYMVAVGYMDPGNWATDIAGGAIYDYALLSVVLLSSLLAVFLQVLTVKLGVATKRDLAQMCAEAYSPRFAVFLWITAEIAIAACDLAEVIGSAIALQLLFGLPLVWGCCLTALDVLIVLSFFDKPGRRFRGLELAVMGLIAVIFVCFAAEIVLSRPSFSGVMKGFFVPDLYALATQAPRLYIAMGILGATVMPHNLYLHSSLVQTRDYGESVEDKAEAIFYSSLDTIIALSLALFVNAAILIVAAAAFFDPSGSTQDAPSVSEAYDLLAPVLGNKAASILFGVALLASGQNSTLTGTLAGQIVMEGFVQVRLKPWLRRLITRLVVIVPAVFTVVLAGDKGVDFLLVLSQVILSFQLSFAVFPLVMFTSDVSVMGTEFVNSPSTSFLAWVSAILIAALNIWLLVMTVGQGSIPA
ncbi:hypothetical protein NSK_000312 [Nannochloropsis salina CCMP1776]|uniref:Uncharacterized protein n=1 Tax=Nannochloropsis salina CCMP1776 TaxID=1027361 RepID=A0A4D9DEX8_9STRA|nr:hypothetical protein NSK_000312 [Nannochloropsis salina CCMP1776]|eukprot:TFJ88743.1 hypothetical protein NSK_000312 [Nannochloropsis salina CCMP1776]